MLRDGSESMYRDLVKKSMRSPRTLPVSGDRDGVAGTLEQRLTDQVFQLRPAAMDGGAIDARPVGDRAALMPAYPYSASSCIAAVITAARTRAERPPGRRVTVRDSSFNGHTVHLIASESCVNASSRKVRLTQTKCCDKSEVSATGS